MVLYSLSSIMRSKSIFVLTRVDKSLCNLSRAVEKHETIVLTSWDHGVIERTKVSNEWCAHVDRKGKASKIRFYVYAEIVNWRVRDRGVTSSVTLSEKFDPDVQDKMNVSIEWELRRGYISSYVGAAGYIDFAPQLPLISFQYIKLPYWVGGDEFSQQDRCCVS